MEVRCLQDEHGSVHETNDAGNDGMNVGGGSVLGKTERSLVSAGQRILGV